MPDPPYRPPPSGLEPDAELARVAAEGQRRIHDASAIRIAAGSALEVRSNEAAQRNVRIALGGHFGSPVRVVSAVLMSAGASMLAGAIAWGLAALDLGFPILVIAIIVRVFAPPIATRSRVASERAWADALPFPMDGYFEVLEAEPRAVMRLQVVLAWSDPHVPREDTLRSVIAVVDLGASIDSRGATQSVLRSSPIAGRTGIRIGNVFVHRNTKIVAYVHRLVDEALLPLHRSYSIARVSLTRD